MELPQTFNLFKKKNFQLWSTRKWNMPILCYHAFTHALGEFANNRHFTKLLGRANRCASNYPFTQRRLLAEQKRTSIVEKSEPSCTAGGVLDGAVWQFLKKFQTEWVSDPAIPTPGINPKETKAVDSDIGAPRFTAAGFITTRRWEQPKYSSRNRQAKCGLYIKRGWT